jgi:hypothetical protein
VFTGGIEAGKGGKAVMGTESVWAQTAPYEFGAMPTSVEGCTKELGVRRYQLTKTQAALRTTKKPVVKKALEERVAELKRRIAELVKTKAKLVKAAKLKAIAKRIAGVADFGYWNDENTGVLPRLQSTWEAAEEYAGRVMDVEPEEEGPAKDWVTKREEPAYQSVLGVEATWRNSVLSAEEAGHAKITSWRARIAAIAARIKEIQGYKHKKPNLWKKYRGSIPGLRTEMKADRAAISQTEDTTLPGWASMLDSIQGKPGSRAQIPELSAVPNPDAGFGGYIWGTQTQIRDLGLKFKGSNSAPENPLEEVYKQLAEEAQKRLAVGNLLDPVFQEFFSHIPRYGGKFHSGGVVPGRKGEDRTIIAQGGEIFAQPSNMQTPGLSAHPTPIVVIEDGAVNSDYIRHIYKEHERETVSEARRRVG